MSPSFYPIKQEKVYNVLALLRLMLLKDSQCKLNVDNDNFKINITRIPKFLFLIILYKISIEVS